MAEILEEKLNEVAGGTKQKYLRYAVKPGDTLESIAQKYRTTIADIIKLNGIRSREGWAKEIHGTLLVPDNT